MRSLAATLVMNFWLFLLAWLAVVASRSDPPSPALNCESIVVIDGREPSSVYRPIGPKSGKGHP